MLFLIVASASELIRSAYRLLVKKRFISDIMSFDKDDDLVSFIRFFHCIAFLSAHTLYTQSQTRDNLEPASQSVGRLVDLESECLRKLVLKLMKTRKMS